MKTNKFQAPILSLAVLLALPVAGPAQLNVHIMDFEVDGTYLFVGSDADINFGIVSGESTLGSFTGTWQEHFRAAATRTGTMTLDFARGSLTIDYEYRENTPIPPIPTWEGTYVVVAGTRSLTGVAGEGTCVLMGGTGPTGPFSLSGTLSR